MSSHDVIDLTREAIRTTLIISSPVLGVGLLVGLVAALLQTLTHIHEQSLSLVPKMVAVLLALAVLLPWLLQYMLEYSARVFSTVPSF